MDVRELGRTGLRVSALGFGCGNGGGLLIRGSRDDQVSVVRRAIDAGVTYFDTAPSYGDGASETNLGAVLRALGVRDRVSVGTKVRVGAAEDPRAAVRRSLEGSLRRLGVERVELLQLHDRIGAGEGALDGERLEAALDALAGVRQDGLVAAIGCTAMGDTEAIERALATARFETAQCYVNAANPSAAVAGADGGGQDFGGVIEAAAARGIGVLAIRVFAAGALAGDVARAPLAGGTGGRPMAGTDYADDVHRAERLEPVARELGLESALELSLRFVLGVGGVSTALVGFSDLAQLEAAVRWSERGPLRPEAVERVLDAAARR